jgi:hypothetical protein
VKALAHRIIKAIIGSVSFWLKIKDMIIVVTYLQHDYAFLSFKIIKFVDTKDRGENG